MNVTIFGGSEPKEGSQAYEEARELGRILARQNHVIITGGYMGTMEAASRGALESGGHTIGVTCEEIENWRKTPKNQWVKEERKKMSLNERLVELISSCDAAMALPGGIGTLTEISLMTNLMVVESIHRRPLILIGCGWQSVFDQLFSQFDGYISARHRELLYFAEDVKTAVKILEKRE